MVSKSSNFSTFSTSTLFQLWIIFLTTLLIFVLIPLLIIILSPLYLFRWIVLKSSKYFRPDLRKMITTRGAAFAAEELYTNPEMVVCIAVQLDGPTDLELLRSKIEETLVNAKCPKTGDQLYPELRENIDKWMGYPFWRPLTSFRITDHVNYFGNKAENSPTTFEELREIMKNLIIKPFSTEKAMWEFFIVPHYIPKSGESSPTGHSLVLLRIHHALVDGYSLLNLMFKISGTKQDDMAKLPKPRLIKRSICSELFATTAFVVKVPYEFTKSVVAVKSRERNAWQLPEKVLRSGISYGSTTDALSLEYLKEIKRVYRVSLTSLILAMITGGVRHMMVKQAGNKDLPEKLRIVLPLPLHGHPNKLRNYMTGGIMSLPIGEPDPIKRLETINKKFEKLKRSTLPFTFSKLPVLMGGLPLSISGGNARKMQTTLMLTNMPGLPEKSCILNHLIEELYFTGALIPGTVAVTFGFNTNGNKARMAAGAFNTILPSQADADELMDNCLKELDILSQAGNV